jgi:outer membrane protein assembly factor BamE
MRFNIILLSLLLAACDSISLPDSIPVPTSYKMDIRQGNFVTAEMREKIKLGMSKSQVKYVLGTPMVSDVFHANRWDYVYRLEQKSRLVEKQRLTLYFENDNLTKIDDSDLHVKPEPAADEAK